MGADPPSRCTTDELPGLIAQLDAEFVSGRGRGISLAQRYPALFSGPDNFFVAREQGRVVTAIAVKPLRWIAGDEEFNGLTAGMVWTEPALRGRGLASELLAQIGRFLRNRADFAVLWTAQPDFYARCGWQASDCASFGVIDGMAGNPQGAPVKFEGVRAIWQQQHQHAGRDRAWQPPLPLPAVSLEMFHIENAYAIAGRVASELYCHEIAGDEALFGALLAQMRAGCRTLYFNERTGSPAQIQLEGLGARWQDKPLAMWLPLRDTGAPAAARDWYIPWLDRI